jgi:hypothetical protein
LDLFVPHAYGYDFKVVVTNKTIPPKKVVAFHQRRGSQEGIFGELKTHCQMGCVPVRKWPGNQTYVLAGLFAHNLLRGAADDDQRSLPPHHQEVHTAVGV